MLPLAARPMPPVIGGREVGEDVAEQVVGDDDVEAGRIGDQEDRGRVDVQVVDGDVGELGRHGVDGAGPEVAGVHQDVVLVHQRQLAARTGLGPREGVADDALDAERGVDADLGGHLLRRADADRAAVADVRPLGALADDHEVDVASIGDMLASGVGTPGYSLDGRRLT